MQDSFGSIIKQFATMVIEFQQQVNVSQSNLLVIGCSTSEVVGEEIGTAGSEIAASIIYDQLRQLQKQTGVALAFQCCEHLNRAIILEREVAEKHGYEEVTVIPTRNAGGAMATYAFEHFDDPVVVEYIKADAGIDIGDTFIGMHLKHVAVPIRITENNLGNAHVTFATTRPKLIGGERAIYKK